MFELRGKLRRSKRPMTTDVHAAEEDDKSHDLKPTDYTDYTDETAAEALRRRGGTRDAGLRPALCSKTKGVIKREWRIEDLS